MNENKLEMTRKLKLLVLFCFVDIFNEVNQKIENQLWLKIAFLGGLLLPKKCYYTIGQEC